MLIVALVLVQNEGKTLLIQEAKPFCYGRWSLPGGRREQGESLTDAAMREVLEEAGVQVRLTGLAHLDQRLADPSGLPDRLRLVFQAEVIGGAPKQTPDEHSLRAAWFTPEEIAALDLRSQVFSGLLHSGAQRVVLPLEYLYVLSVDESAFEQRK